LPFSFHSFLVGLQRAGGDVKKNGMEPYAFVPLQSVAGKKSGSRGPKMGITGLKKKGRKE
jgi:ribosomal RNA-processing protein 12